jgi:hypothetical protein
MDKLVSITPQNHPISNPICFGRKDISPFHIRNIIQFYLRAQALFCPLFFLLFSRNEIEFGQSDRYSD